MWGNREKNRSKTFPLQNHLTSLYKVYGLHTTLPSYPQEEGEVVSNSERRDRHKIVISRNFWLK